MVKLYVADISHLPDPLSFPKILNGLPLERQQRIHNMKKENSRKQSMRVGLLLQKVLALYHMQESQVFVGDYGKPLIDGLEFSLSHSGNLVVCAVSDQPVGCDVEEIREAPKGVAKRYFSSGEQLYLSRFAGEEYDKVFFQLWTMKESYVKMTGEGLRVPFDAYEVVPEDSAQVMRDGKIQACYLSTMDLQGHIISICAESSAHVEVIWGNI